MKRIWKALVALAFFAAPAWAADGELEIQVIPTSAGSLYANCTLIKGKDAAVLVDVPFTRADAHRVVAEILDSGKRLEAVYVTHDHPDHFFSIDVVVDAFPDVKVITHEQVVADIWRSMPFKIKRWMPLLGDNGPKYTFVPTALAEDHFELEGQRIEVLGPMQGDHVHATALWVPSVKALIAGDLVYNDMYVWVGEHEEPERLAFIKSLDYLASLKPDIVVAGHTKPGSVDGPETIAWSRDYLIAFNDMAKKAKTSDELAAMIVQAYPDAIDVIDGFLLGYSSKVATGEMPPWQE